MQSSPSTNFSSLIEEFLDNTQKIIKGYEKLTPRQISDFIDKEAFWSMKEKQLTVEKIKSIPSQETERKNPALEKKQQVVEKKMSAFARKMHEQEKLLKTSYPEIQKQDVSVENLIPELLEDSLIQYEKRSFQIENIERQPDNRGQMFGYGVQNAPQKKFKSSLKKKG